MTTEKTLQSVSQWLSELDSHSIYDSAVLKLDFTNATGQPAPDWPEHTPEETRRAMDGRGLGGTHNPNGKPECYGYSLANYFARKLANYSTDKMGRGFAFRDCIDHIKKAGF